MKKILQIISVFFLLLFFALKNFSQNKIKDSLLIELQNAKEDTNKVKILCNLCSAFRNFEPDKALEYGEKGISLSEKLKFEKGKSDCFHEKGIVYYYQGKYDKALECYLSAIKILEKISEEKKNNFEIQRNTADNIHDIGKVYYRQQQYDNSLQKYEQALAIYKQLNYKPGIATCYNNIGGIYDAKKDFEKTLFYFKESLKITEEIGDKYGIAPRLNNIGLLYQSQKKYDEALNYLLRAMKIREESQDTRGLAYSYNDIGGLYLELKNYERAVFYLSKGLEYAKKSNSKERLKENYQTFAKTYSKMKQFEKAFEFQLLLAELKDSIFSEQSSKQIAEMSAKYETEKKQKEIELQNVELQKKEAEVKRQNTQKIAFGAGFLFVLILAVVIFRGYKQKEKSNKHLEKANSEITEQKHIIELQKKIVEEKNNDITDSINYAKYIQQAIFPSEKDFLNTFPESFVLFKPKDIVSGDFYWLSKQNQKIFFAVCDCTGHGVPGAFMSVMCNSFLNEVVNKRGISKPSEILDVVRNEIITTMKQGGKEGGQKDGMDTALCAFDRQKNTLEFSGANNPLWIIPANDSRIIEVQADNQPVSYFSDVPKKFTNHFIELKKGDSIYVFTDGYADQFGGPKGKKFKYSQLEKLLVMIKERTMNEQKIILNDEIEKWKSNLEQIDDICVMGMRV